MLAVDQSRSAGRAGTALFSLASGTSLVREHLPEALTQTSRYDISRSGVNSGGVHALSGPDAVFENEEHYA